MARFFQPARVPAGGTSSPSVQSCLYTTGQTFLKGAVLIWAAAGTVSEAGADPVANVAGVALDPAGSKPGFNPANSNQVLQVTGIQQEVSVALARGSTVFSGRGTQIAGGDPFTPLVTHINEEYGLVKDANGLWAIDFDEVTAKSVRIIDIDIEQKIFFFIFIPAVTLVV